MELGSKNVTLHLADVFEIHQSTLKFLYLFLFGLSLIICRLTACQTVLTIAHIDMGPIPTSTLVASLPSYAASIVVPALDFLLSFWYILLEALHNLLRDHNVCCKASLQYSPQSSETHITSLGSMTTITFLTEVTFRFFFANRQCIADEHFTWCSTCSIEFSCRLLSMPAIPCYLLLMAF